MTRLLSVTLLLAVLAGGGIARAQTTGGSDTGTGGGSLPNGATLVFSRLRNFKLDDSKTGPATTGGFHETEANSDDRLQGFSLAACNCGKANQVALDAQSPPPDTSELSAGWFQYQVTLSALTGLHNEVKFWVGTSCTDDTLRPKQCRELSYATIGDLDTDLSARGGGFFSYNLYDFINGELHNGEVCQQTSSATMYTFISTTNSDDTFDFSFQQAVGTEATDPTTTNATGIDTQPPPAPDPTKIRANPIDQAIKLTWTAPTERNTDIAYYEALCADTTGSVVRHSAGPRKYVTTRQLCGATIDKLTADDLAPEALQPIASAPSPDDLPVNPDPNGQFAQLNESYICGVSLSGTANSLTIDGLQNGKQYQVILLTIDLYGNYVAQYFDHTVTPIPVTDFWEDLHDRGSQTQGGLCLLNETYGDDSGINTGLRALRDDALAASAPGRALTRAYYATLGQWGGLVHGSLALRIVAGVVLAPLVAFGLAWHWLTLPGLFALLVLGRLAWRRRGALAPAWLTARRASAAAGVSLALLVLAGAPGLARADKFQPYWETDPLDKTTDSNGTQSNDNPDYDPQFDPALNALPQNSEDAPKTGEEIVGPSESKWILGVRAGPYTPDIDKQLGGPSPGPYKQMFGGKASIVPMVDFDRVLLDRFGGQITAGLSIGFLHRSADAFSITSKPTDPNRQRIPGATNSFTLIPFALLAGYRFTLLSDNYNIPLVPYVRGGLAYYPWFVRAPAGGFAEICDANGNNCGNRALGASLGVQGSIGLSIRAESISASTAQSIRQSGFQHIGIYGELSIAQVDGFGSDKKLSVGDRNWFGGINFEF
jgi:hypothetical protein